MKKRESITINKEFEKKRCFITLIASFIFGMFAHLFGIVNVIKNYDNAYVFKGYGDGILSGRWFLSLIGDNLEKIWGGNWNLQFYNGVITILVISVSAYIIIRIFDIRDLKFCVLWAAIFVAFPSVTAMELYVYTAPYYSIAILMAVLAVYFSIEYKYGFILGIILGACSIGIYQAYFPIMIGLFVTVMIDKAMAAEEDWKTLILMGIKYLGTLLSSLLVYFILLKSCLKIFGLELNNYQGIDQMGKIDLAELPEMIQYLYSSFIHIVSEDYVGVSATGFIRVMILILGLLSGSMLAYLIIKRKDSILKKGKGILIAVICVYPIALNGIVIMCYHSYMHTLMVHAIVLLFLMPFLVYRHFEKEVDCNKNSKWCNGLKKVIMTVSILVFLNYAYQANAAYTALYYKNQQANNYWTSIITQVKMQEGFNSDLSWSFVGEVKDELYWNPWYQDYCIAGNTNNVLNAYSTGRFIEQYYGYYIPFVDEEEQKKLEVSEEVKKMPNYPDDGSIKILGDTVVIKFSDIQESVQ